MGTIEQIGVRTDNSGPFAAWHLAMVEVTHGLTGKTTVFPCKKWFDADSGDKKTERWLKAGVGEVGPDGQPLEEHKDVCQYKVTVYTSDVLGAGAQPVTVAAGAVSRGLLWAVRATFCSASKNMFSPPYPCAATIDYVAVLRVGPI